MPGRGFWSTGPRTAMFAIPSRPPGNAISPSSTRMIMVSVSPPRYPAMRPSGTPRAAAVPIEITPTRTETDAPWTIRLRMSRPRSSVPRRCRALGPVRRSTFISVGEYGASHGAATAASATSPTTASARAVTSALRLEPDARVQPHVGQVHQEVDDHERRGHQQDHRLDDRVVAVLDRREGEAADARPREDLLDHEGAAHQGAELEREHGDHRQEGVLQRVPDDHGMLGQPLGAGGADVLGAEHVQHPRAEEAREWGGQA